MFRFFLSSFVFAFLCYGQALNNISVAFYVVFFGDSLVNNVLENCCSVCRKFPNIDKIVVLENARLSDFLDFKPDAAMTSYDTCEKVSMQNDMFVSSVKDFEND